MRIYTTEIFKETIISGHVLVQACSSLKFTQMPEHNTVSTASTKWYYTVLSNSIIIQLS